MTLKIHLFSILLFIPNIFLYSQNLSANDDKSFVKFEEAALLSSGDYAPFWLSNNKYGIASTKNNKMYARFGVFYNDTSVYKHSKISIGADLLISNNLQKDIYIQQLYANVSYKIANVFLGMKEQYLPFRNPYLSSGTMTSSNNARPIPQIGISTNGFIDVPYTKGYLQAMGGASYGWFNDGDFKKSFVQNGNYITNVLYHRKHLFFKYANKSPFSIIFGLEADTQWGGDLYAKGELAGKMPRKLSDYFRVLTGASGGKNALETDQDNALGNIYGSWHLVLNYEKENYAIKTYYEHFWEDNSGLVLRNPPDGTYGIEVNFKRNQLVSSILFEYIYTKDQSGHYILDEEGNDISKIRAVDNYYNNGVYGSESNYGYVMGNPLLTSPIYNSGGNIFVRNNMVVAYHGGISGYINNNLTYRALATYTRSKGTMRNPFPKSQNQFSTLLEMNYALPQNKAWQFSGSFAFDKSGIIGDNIGVQLKVIKTIDFNR